MIKVLEKHVSDKIAAGEVIDRPASIVKELLENAVDAGAGDITVEIKKGGKTYLRITDNGCGIEADEAETAFLRHATSKIVNEEDLHSLLTLGFRGEALASIAAVARVSMITKTKEARVGCRVSIEGGDVLENTATGCPDGTTFVIRDLFYNTPAREKFLKSDSSETAAITELVRSEAMAYPQIAFHMISNEKILFSTRGDGNRLHAIQSVVGIKNCEHLVSLTKATEGLSLTGFVSGTGESKASKREQIFFVNGRVIDSKPIEKALQKAYADRLFAGRYPVAYLFLEIDPSLIDVNIHPNKREIRFDDDKLITDFIREAIQEALTTKEAVPEIQLGESQIADQSFPPNTQRPNTQKVSGHVKETSAFHGFEKPVGTQQEMETPTSPDVAGKKAHIAGIISEYLQENKASLTMPEKGKGGKAKTTSQPLTEAPQAPKASSDSNKEKAFTKEMLADLPFDLTDKSEAKQPFSFSDLTVTGAVFDTYIVATDREAVYFIDQHAAHERINYEKIILGIMSAAGNSQMMLAPKLLEVPFSDAEWTIPLTEMGYEIDEFGPETWRLKAIPSFMDEKAADEFLAEYIDLIDEGTAKDATTELQSIVDRAATKACKASVKAQDVLSEVEIRHLVSTLALCENPFNCPHGRPTFLRLKKYELEKHFRRV